MELLAVSDVVWNALIVAVAGLAMKWMSDRAAEKVAAKVDVVAAKVETVKVTRAEEAAKTNSQLEGLKETTDTIHKIVNSGAIIQLKINAELSRWKSDRTGDPKDVEAAAQAEALYHTHASEQERIGGPSGAGTAYARSQNALPSGPDTLSSP